MTHADRLAELVLLASDMEPGERRTRMLALLADEIRDVSRDAEPSKGAIRQRRWREKKASHGDVTRDVTDPPKVSPEVPPYNPLPKPLPNPPEVSIETSQSVKRAREPIDAWKPKDPHFELAWSLSHDERWVEDAADSYRCWLANAKHKHKDFDAGFRNWIKSSHRKEAKDAGAGRQRSLGILAAMRAIGGSDGIS